MVSISIVDERFSRNAEKQFPVSVKFIKSSISVKLKELDISKNKDSSISVKF